MNYDFSNAQRAEVLTQALPHIQKYYGKASSYDADGSLLLRAWLGYRNAYRLALSFVDAGGGVSVYLQRKGSGKITRKNRKGIRACSYSAGKKSQGKR